MSNNPFDELLYKPEGPGDTWRWAVVEFLNPLVIRLDHEDDPLAGSPINLAGPLEVGDRVWVQLHRSHTGFEARPIIMGKRQAEPSGAVSLGSVELSGDVRSPVRSLHIPQHLQNKFDYYKMIVKVGIVDSTTVTRPLCIYPNGDTGENYHAVKCVGHSNLEVSGSANNQTTAFPRTGYMGAYEGSLEINWTPRHPRSPTNLMVWTTYGWSSHTGTDSVVVEGGGRWEPGSMQTLTHFEFNTNSSGLTWRGHSKVYLWGYR